MRYAIFADVHSNLEALAEVIKAYMQEAVDQYLCAGDIVGYAANPRECIGMVKSLDVIAVAGNHDWASVDLLSADYFNPAARLAITWTKRNLDEEGKLYLESLKLVFQNKDLTLVHGALNNPKDFDYLTNEFAARDTFGLLKSNICFVGHTHIAGMFIQDKYNSVVYQEDRSVHIKEENRYIVNVGSVGQPRDRNPEASYCIYDTAKKEVQIKRVGYDMRVAREKIISAGLPRYLGDRLLKGR